MLFELELIGSAFYITDKFRVGFDIVKQIMCCMWTCFVCSLQCLWPKWWRPWSWRCAFYKVQGLTPLGCIQSFGAIGLGEFNCPLNYKRCTCGKLLVEGLCTPWISWSKCFGQPLPIKKKILYSKLLLSIIVHRKLIFSPRWHFLFCKSTIFIVRVYKVICEHQSNVPLHTSPAPPKKKKNSKISFSHFHFMGFLYLYKIQFTVKCSS